MSLDLIRSFDGIASRIDATGARSVGFTSALFGEGVSTIAIGTALALAALRRDSVLLVDANWIHPTLTADASLGSAPGLAEYLAGKADVSGVVHQAPTQPFAFIPLGDRAAARPTLRSLAALLANDAAQFQTVLVDLPPVMAGEGYVLPWASLLDRLFVVLREAATPLGLVRSTLGKIGLATPPEIVLNRTAHTSPAMATAFLAARRHRA
jgi:Mrp family chromosome partitioning ATPase